MKQLASTQQAAALSISRQPHSLTVSQALAYFEKTLNKPNNYLRIVRRYFEYCIREGFLIDRRNQLWVLYRGEEGECSLAVRKFVKFALERGIFQVVPDLVKRKGLPPAANELVLAFLDSAKTLNEESKITYTKSMNTFFEFLERKGLNFSGRSVSLFVSRMKEEQLSTFTINVRLSAVKQLACWVIRNRHRLPVDFNSEQLEALRDVDYVEGPKTEKYFHKDGLSEEAREQLMGVVEDIKWKAVISLMAWCGLRTVEVTRLKVRDVDFSNGRLYVLGKGKDVKVPVKLFKVCQEHLQAYLLLHTELGQGDALFPGLLTSHIRFHTKKFLERAGLKGEKISAHSLRHTAAQVLLKKGVEPIYVQRQLRHQEFATTQIYIKQQSEQEYFLRMPDG